jgi:hypothetical protein
VRCWKVGSWTILSHFVCVTSAVLVSLQLSVLALSTDVLFRRGLVYIHIQQIFGETWNQSQLIMGDV